VPLHIPDDVVFRDLAGEAVILNLTTGTYFGLDPVGTRIWQLLQSGGTIDAIMPALLQEYDVEEPALRRDVDALVGRLLDKGLLATC
jgi:Coenzyme PQQ synthesis protein D (PqqD)